MRIVLVTEAWHPLVNGVVRTWTHVTRELAALGHEVLVIHPRLFRTVGMPRYPEIRLSLLPGRKFRKMVQDFAPAAVHIATEGPLGQAARRYCLRRGLPYTTSFHTQFAPYLKIYYGIPPTLTYRFLRWFHGRAQRTLVPTNSVRAELQSYGLANLVVWGRGVDTKLFHPQGQSLPGLPRPIFLTAGRVALEKNIEAFLALDLPGSKVVVGDGPARVALQRKYPSVTWTGYLHDEELARYYSAADVFVFPSRSDTFGNVMQEANACGVPVAAYPVTGPIDVVQPGVTGVLHEDLRTACLEALKVPPAGCRAYAEARTWRHCAQIVLDNLAPINAGPASAPACPAAGIPGTAYESHGVV
jgi:glycosyltransferase involved in cell wall biosynthesis